MVVLGSLKNLAMALLLILFLMAIPLSCGGSSKETVSDGSSSGGSGSTSGSRTRTFLGSLGLPGLNIAWAPISGVFGGDGHVNQFVFVANKALLGMGIRFDGSTIFEHDGSTLTSTGEAAPYFAGVYFLSNKSPSFTLPPIQALSSTFPSGDYSFKIGNLEGSDATIDVYQIHKNDPDLSSGIIDINLYIYTLGEDNPVIPNTTEAGNIKNYLNEFFNPIGISIGSFNVEFVEDASAILQVLTDDGLTSFLESASLATSGRSDNGINCFIFPRLSGDTLGLDGSIPGPAMHGTPSSGLVAMAAEQGISSDGLTSHQTDQKIVSKILGHEIGHYLGLFHTTEGDISSGVRSDPLTDTPECGAENDADGDGELAGAECIGNGTDNMMFWTTYVPTWLLNDFQTELSPQQRSVMNTHPSVL